MKLFVVYMDLAVSFERSGFTPQERAGDRKVLLIAEDQQQALGRARAWLEEITRSPDRRDDEFKHSLYTKVLSVEILKIEGLEIEQGLVVLPL
jgi:hypothetical protein